MHDPLAEKLAYLGLDRRGVLSPLQKDEAYARYLAEMRRTKNPSVRILETRIAHTESIEDYARTVDELALDDRLTMKRSESSCPAGRAVAFFDGKGRRLGFVPAEQGKEIWQLLDDGEELYAQVLYIDAHRQWADISVGIYLERK